MKVKTVMTRYIPTFLLLVGVVASVGFLSFSGLLVVYPHLVPAIFAFFLSGCVEGEVYRQNILGGFKKFKLLGNAGFDRFIIQALDKQASQKKNRDQCEFLRDYYEQKSYVEWLKDKKLIFFDKKKLALSKTEKAEWKAEKAKRRLAWRQHKKAAKETLRRMQMFFVENVFAAPGVCSDPELQPFVKAVQNDLPVITRKMKLMRIGALINVLAAMGSGFATVSVTKAALVMLSAKFAFVLSATALSALIWPLAALAAGAYFWIICNTIADIIYNVAKWRKKLGDWFSPQKGETEQWLGILKYAARVTLTGLLVGSAIVLAVFATLATAGTWWLAVKNGAALISYLTKFAAHIRTITVAAVTITQLLFNVKNSLDAVKIIKKSVLLQPARFVKEKIKALKSKCKAINAKENFLQWINIPRILAEVIFNIAYPAIVAGHLVATGLTADRFGKLNSLVVAAPTVVSEIYQDIPYVTSSEEKAASNKPQQQQHDHEHGNIIEWTVKAILAPLLFLAAGWNWLASQANRVGGDKLVLSFGGKKPVLTFAEAFKQSFGIKKVAPAVTTVEEADNKKPRLSKKWLAQEQVIKFAEEKKRLDSVFINQALASQKKTVINELEQHLKNQQSNIDIFLSERKLNDISYKQILATPRRLSIFSGSKKEDAKTKTSADLFVESLRIHLQ